MTLQGDDYQRILLSYISFLIS